MGDKTNLKTLIVGAGFGGIAAAIELRAHGFEDITILDRASSLGGTWHHNSYPGAACDVPSQLYSYSFAQRKDWVRLCPLQSDILGYLKDVAREHGVDRLVVGDTEVSACDWSDDSRRWTITAADGRSWEADVLVVATGQLHRKAFPRIEGLESFAGNSFHSAEWDHDQDLRGKRVAVVGTGASAVQFVPEVAEEAGHLTVFQRTGNWFMPRKNRPYPAWVRAAIRRVPGLQAYRRWFIFKYGESLTLMIRNPKTFGRVGKLRATLFMRWQLRDPEVRKRAWPDFQFGCKRVIFSSAFLPSLQRPNVSLVNDRITAITAAGVVTADGTEHPVDTIIWGTGFRTNDFMFPMEITGADGRSLREAWADGPHAHLGITVPGFPSMFLMYGPNTNTSGGSIVFYLEQQAAYIRQALQRVRDHGAAAIDVRPEVEARTDREVQDAFSGTAWLMCDSWYVDRDGTGRVIANWPRYMRDYERATRTLDPADFTFVARADEPVTASSRD